MNDQPEADTPNTANAPNTADVADASDPLLMMVVDDDRLTCVTLRASLANEHREVVTAPDGEAAWEIIRARHPRLIITGRNPARAAVRARCSTTGVLPVPPAARLPTDTTGTSRRRVRNMPLR